LPKKTPPDTIETIRRLHLDQGLSGVAIAKQLNLPVSTVNYILKKLGRKVMKPVKQATEAQIKDEQAIQEIQGAVRESLERRKKSLEVLEAIRDRPPVKVQTRQGEITLDDAPLKIKAALAINELQNSLDEMLGIMDVSVRKEVMKLREEVARLRRSVQGSA